jgi:hypothetical protein
MLVKELIDALSKIDPETEIMLFVRGTFEQPSFSTTNIEIKTGYAVRDTEESVSFYNKKTGNGLFVEKTRANRIMDDGQKFLDLTSPTIYPAIQLEVSRDR